jgi:SAM-dependent methyltransferase
MSRFQSRFYPESRFGGFTARDGTVAFYSRVGSLLNPDSRVLDVGCGRGSAAADPLPFRRQLRNVRGRAACVIGIDVSPAGQANPFLDDFRLIPPSGRWPLAASSVDLAIADWVLEHVPDPALFFAEAIRVLTPGGVLCMRTTNALGYVGILGRLVPNRLHASVAARTQGAPGERRADDFFPTLYRCNTRRSLRRSLAAAGFDAIVYAHDSEPRYCEFSALAYAAAVLVHRLSPPSFKTTLFAFGRRGA